MTKTILLKILPEDIDNYGHLNNAKTPCYFEIARQNFLRRFGLDSDSLTGKGLGFLVRKADYEYIKQVFEGDFVYISSRIEMADFVSLNLRQEMTRFQDKELVARANARYFFYDFMREKPIRIPKDFLEILGR